MCNPIFCVNIVEYYSSWVSTSVGSSSVVSSPETSSISIDSSSLASKSYPWFLAKVSWMVTSLSLASFNSLSKDSTSV